MCRARYPVCPSDLMTGDRKQANILTNGCPVTPMTPIEFGLIAGLAFALTDTALMIPMQFEDKKAALLGAFLSRFAIGFLIPLVALPLPRVVTGLIVSLLVSLPDAVITKAYGPILGTGVVGGLLIGWLAGWLVV